MIRIDHRTEHGYPGTDALHGDGIAVAHEKDLLDTDPFSLRVGSRHG
jgi:hypothetical protein